MYNHTQVARYAQFTPHITTWNLSQKSVIVRADLNTDIHDVNERNYKIEALLPTLEYLLKQGATINLITHRGSPHGYDETLSTAPLKSWFQAHGYPVDTQLMVYENIRFHPEEHTHNVLFAQKLAQSIDFYINDAFGVEHRADTSLTTLALQFPPERRSIGYLVDRELTHIYRALLDPYPLVLIVGGGKIDKLNYIARLLPYVTTILLCPGHSNALLFPHLYDESLQHAITLLQHGVATGTVMMPLDYLTRQQSIRSSDSLSEDDLPIAVGPTTLVAWRHFIQQAHTLVFNGPMGFFDQPDTLEASSALIKEVCQSKAYSIIGGDSSVHLVQQLNLEKSISYISTGGGSLLALMSNYPLPGLEALMI